MSQARQLAEAKNELEDAMIQIRSVRRPEWQGAKIVKLRYQIKLSNNAERRSRKALDDLTVTLRDVTVEASMANAKLLLAENDLKEVRDQVECTKSTLRSCDEKHRASLDEIEKLRKEIEESTSKRGGFRDCIRLIEVEIERGKMETARLIEAREASKEETTKIKEALDIALTENSRLKDLISEKDDPPEKINMAMTEISGSMKGNRRCRSWSKVKDFVRSDSPNFQRRNSDHTYEVMPKTSIIEVERTS